MKWCFNKKHNCIRALAFKRQRVWYPKIIASLSAFITSAHSLGTTKFRVPWPFFTTPTLKPFNQLLAVLNLYQHAKNQVYFICYFCNTVNFRFPWQGWPHLFLSMATQKQFWSTFKFRESVSTCKKSVHSICSLFRYRQF